MYKKCIKIIVIKQFSCAYEEILYIGNGKDRV